MTHFLLSTGYTACGKIGVSVSYGGLDIKSPFDLTTDEFFVTCPNCVARMAH